MQKIDLTKIDEKYKNKCSLIKAGTCKNVNIFLHQSEEIKRYKQAINDIENTIKQSNIDFQSEIKLTASELDNHLNLLYRHKLTQIITIINKAKEVNNAG